MASRPTIASFIGIAAFVACSSGPDAGTAGFEADPPGSWFAGDVHVHSTGASNDTGGDSLPADIAARAKERGLHFVVLTDHSNSTGSDVTTTDEDPALFNRGPEFPYWDETRRVSDPGRFLMVDGNELSPVAEGERPAIRRGHIGCLPGELETFDTSGAFVDRPRGDVTGGQALAQARARGCFTIVNHPYSAAVWTNYDWTGLDYDGVEIWNGGLGFDPDDLHGYDAWRCDLLAGRRVTPIAASDNHRVNTEPPGRLIHPALGWPKTSVFAAELTWSALLDAFRNGRVALHEGDSVAILDAYDADRRRVGDAAGNARWIRLRGQLDARSPAAVLRLVRATSCNDLRPSRDPPVVAETVVFEAGVLPGKSFDHAASIDGGPGVYTALLRPLEGEHYFAITRALVVR